ncbi:hypothetical protein [Bdellovibrio bacteriovorus]|uniref:hypothetical protein n=1 Tax=Bdellovibrio bacteriovorus TaxID=959 RepID=UPI0011D1A4EE|nr:hypothetical protein [Bdellovibrio bacteriovorus]
MKNLVCTVLGVLLLSSGVQAVPVSAALAEKARKLADHLQDVESQLVYADHEEVRYSLEKLEITLGRYQKKESRVPFACISNGSSDHFERFVPTDLATNKVVGGGTSLDKCRQLIEKQMNGLMCVSNGSDDHFERFSPLDLATRKKIGGGTSFDACQVLIAKATSGFMCVSNGSDGAFESFILRDLKNARNIGGGTSLDNCLSAIPR